MPPGALSLPELGTVLSSEGVTVLWLTAGLFHLMVEQELEALASVRQVGAGSLELARVTLPWIKTSRSPDALMATEFSRSCDTEMPARSPRVRREHGGRAWKTSVPTRCL